MPEVFGWEHFLYLGVVLALMIPGLILIRRFLKEEKQVDRLLKIIGFVLLAAITWNRISVAAYRDGFDSILPGTFCGSSSLALALAAIFLRRNHAAFHCIAYTGLLGGLLTLIYPDYIGQASSIFFPMTISGLVHHTIMAFLVTVMLMTGFLKPELRKWYILPLGLCVYMTYGLFLITVLGYGDAMYIHEPILEGTPLNWIVLGVIFITLHAAFLFAWERFFRPKNEVNMVKNQ